MRLTHLGSMGLTPLLKLGASSVSRRNIGSKTIRSKLAERNKTGMSSSSMNVIQVIVEEKVSQVNINSWEL